MSAIFILVSYAVEPPLNPGVVTFIHGAMMGFEPQKSLDMGLRLQIFYQKCVAFALQRKSCRVLYLQRWILIVLALKLGWWQLCLHNVHLK